MSIPQWRYRASLRFSVENVAHLRTKFFAVISDQNVGSQTNRYRPLGVSAQCNTRHFQISGLFLNSTGISDNHHGLSLKSQEFNIGQRLQEMKRRSIQIKSREGLARARVNRKTTRNRSLISSNDFRMPLKMRASSTLEGRCSVTRA